jgi:hypothetical protein
MDQPRDQPSDLPTPLPPLTSGPQYGPEWWTERHTTAWERAKEALQRDWAQTKADFSSTHKDLKQGVGDTVRQTLGSAPIPPPDSPTHALDADDLHAARAKRDEGLGKAAAITDDARARIAEAREELAQTVELSREQSAADHKALDARAAKLETEARATVAAAAERASRETGKQSARLAEAERERTEAHRAWDEAESDARYGFGVRLQHAAAQPWSPELEAALKAEWSALNLGRDWDTSRREVRRGWDFGTSRL